MDTYDGSIRIVDIAYRQMIIGDSQAFNHIIVSSDINCSNCFKLSAINSHLIISDGDIIILV